MSLTLEELERFASRLSASPERWRRHVRHARDARVYEKIWDDEDINAWVICWSADQDTGFHDHDGSGAGIVVISGRVREERLRLGAPPHTREFGPGAVLNVPPVAIHRVLHAGDQPAVTIHVYSPPLKRTGTYRVGPDGELERQSQPFEIELRPSCTRLGSSTPSPRTDGVARPHSLLVGESAAAG
ncbi:MAG: cysteine dioxygenase [Solirubrobacteraceae bacterium]|jgi:mannose-6-phosphate isomerase-like protein (cupin superfamily)